jgi:hypothetical protein
MQLVTEVDQHHIVLCLPASNVEARRNHVLLFPSFREFVGDREIEPSRCRIGEALTEVQKMS